MERPSGAEVRRDGREGRSTARRDRARSSRERVAGLAVAIAFALSTTGCREAPKPADTRDADDHARLARIVSADEDLDRALKAADDASHAGDDANGASILETDATHAADEAIAIGEREPVEAAWARARRDTLVSVIRERRASIPSYAEAMRGEDLEAKLAVVTLQIDLQKQALEAASAALAPTPTQPPAQVGHGDAG
jgi:hypothetical protein